jgi:hypothetical protein
MTAIKNKDQAAFDAAQTEGQAVAAQLQTLLEQLTPLFEGVTTPSAPDSGATPPSSAGAPAAITPEEIKNAMGASGMGSPDQLQIYDYGNFGHYAAAYVMAADENVYLVLFNDETGGWAILCTYTGLDWEAVQADLRAKAAPEDLIQWANPGEG